MSQIPFLFRQMYRHKFSYLVGIFAIIATNWMTVTIPTYLQRAVDLLSLGVDNIRENQSDLSNNLLMIMILAIAVVVVRTLSRVFFFNPGRWVEYEVKNQLFKKLTHLDKEYYDKNKIGAIISKLQNDITGLRVLSGFGVMQLFNIITALSLTPYKMWQLSPSLTFYCILPVIVVFGLLRVGIGWLMVHTRNRQTNLQNLSSYIVSSLNGVDVLKGYSLEDWSRKNFQSKNQDLLKETLSISFIRSFMMPILGNLENILKILVLLVGGMAVIQGDFTIGELTAFIAYSALLTHPIMGLGWLATFFQQGLVGLESIQTILNQPADKAERPRLAPGGDWKPSGQGIEIRNLTYHYPGAKDPILKNLSFRIPPKQTVGILGKIGSGKSTLVDCINGYLTTTDDTVFYNGIDINQMNLKDLRGQVRTVSQEVFLFSDSVKANILFGKQEDAPNGPIDQVIDRAALTDEIDRFPLGIETMVGEKGIMLSGGQKQRISLARAMVEECELLILDNVLSAVDQETERFLLNEILKRDTAHSLLIISHRVQALEDADLILVLDQGEMVQSGTHEDLVNQPGIYQETYELQNETSHD